MDQLVGVLERSLTPLGPSWAEKGGQHGSKLAAKKEPQSIKKPILKLIRAKNRAMFGSIMIYFLENMCKVTT